MRTYLAILLYCFIMLVILPQNIFADSQGFFQGDLKGYYDYYGYYLFEPPDHIIVVTGPNDVVNPATDNNGVSVIDTTSMSSKYISFIEFSAGAVYVYPGKIIVAGLIRKEGEDFYPRPLVGVGFYVLDPYTYSLVAKTTDRPGGVIYDATFYPRATYTANGLLVPVPYIVINGSSYAIIYRVRVEGSVNAERLVMLKTHYYPYLAPITYGDKILWGPFILSAENGTLLYNVSGSADISHISFVVNDTYYFTRLYDKRFYFAIDLVAYNLSSNSIIYTRTIMNYTFGPYQPSILYYGVFGSKIVFILAYSSTGLGLYGIDHIEVFVHDIDTGRTYSLGEYRGKSYYVGRYVDKIIVAFGGEDRMLVIMPLINETTIIGNITALEEITDAMFGSLIITYSRDTNTYKLIFLPILSAAFYVIILKQKEVRGLSEPGELPLLLTLVLTTYIFIYKNRPSKASQALLQ